MESVGAQRMPVSHVLPFTGSRGGSSTIAVGTGQGASGLAQVSSIAVGAR